jgi:hemoglobin-like flavoprotein
LKEKVEYMQTIDFTSFAHGVIEAYEEAYDKLEVVPISFREEVYENDKVALDLYLIGSAGIFDIYVK